PGAGPAPERAAGSGRRRRPAAGCPARGARDEWCTASCATPPSPPEASRIVRTAPEDRQRVVAEPLTPPEPWATKSRMDAREKIISTAVRLFSTQGYGNTSLSQVAKEAEVSKALIFWHFDKQESLFRTAVQRTLEPYFINVLDDLAGLSEVDQIKRLVDQYYAFVSENLYSVKFFLSLILREEKHPGDLVGHMNELQRVYLNLLTDIL